MQHSNVQNKYYAKQLSYHSNLYKIGAKWLYEIGLFWEIFEC